MSAWSTMPIDCLTALRLAAEEHAGEGTSIRTTVLSLCIEAVAFAREGRAREVGPRARSAATLLLELTCPELDPRAVEALAAACERAAVSRR